MISDDPASHSTQDSVAEISASFTHRVAGGQGPTDKTLVLLKNPAQWLARGSMIGDWHLGFNGACPSLNQV
jgi:hypothetical protein